MFLLILLLIYGVQSKCVSEYPKELDVGIYWAQKIVVNNSASLTWQKSCLGATPISTKDIPPILKPNRDTLIIFHGLGPDYVENKQRFTDTEGIDQIVLPWIQTGWQVGVFEWTQFSDHGVERFMLAESNLYTSRYYTTMEYKHFNSAGKLVESESPISESVTDMAVKAYKAHMESIPIDVHHEFRLMGHSLGSQLVILAAHAILLDDSIERKPNRVAVLDIVFSPGPKGYLESIPCGHDTSSVLGCYIKDLVNAGIAVEVYKSSAINRCLFSSENYPSIVQNAVFTTVTLNIWGDIPLGQCYSTFLFKPASKMTKDASALATQIRNQHSAIVPYYMLSKFQSPKSCYLVGTKDNQQCIPKPSQPPSAATPTIQLLHLTFEEYGDQKTCFHQYNDEKSTKTLTPSDDFFYELPCITVHT